MIAICSTSNKNRVKAVIDSLTETLTLSYNQIGDFCVWLSCEYTITKYGEATHAYAGSCYINKHGTNNSYDPVMHTTEELEYAIGSFVHLVFSVNSIEIRTSLYKDEEIYYYKLCGSLVYISNLKMLTVLIKSDSLLELNISYCVASILGEESFGNDTYFKDVGKIMLGEGISTDCNEISIRYLFNKPHSTSQTLTQIVKENIIQLGIGRQQSSLMMSGGLDSGYLFCLMKKLELNFKAIHKDTDDKFRETEVVSAIDLARSIQHELVIVRDSTDDLRENSGKSSFLEGLVTIFYGKISEIIPYGGIIITGYGGDQVFIQNPDYKICFDILIEKGVISGLCAAIKLCRLKKANFYLTIWYILTSNSIMIYNWQKRSRYPSWISSINNINKNKHFLLRGLDERSGRYNNIRSILSALSKKPSSSLSNKVLCPFLLQNVIGFVLKHSLDEHFNENYDRLLLRQELDDNFKNKVAWRRSKKPSTSIIMLYMRDEMSNIISKVESSPLTQQGFIDKDLLSNEIKANSIIKLEDNFHFISRFFTIQEDLEFYMD